MFTRPDNTYNDIREKSLMQWLDEMEQHSDVAVRGGVKLTPGICAASAGGNQTAGGRKSAEGAVSEKNEREKLQIIVGFVTSYSMGSRYSITT